MMLETLFLVFECVCYFSIAALKLYNQGNLQKEGFICAYSSREIRVQHSGEGWPFSFKPPHLEGLARLLKGSLTGALISQNAPSFGLEPSVNGGP